MKAVALKPVRRERKLRYNVTMYPSDVRRLDAYARRMGCSRSEFIVFCFNCWEAMSEVRDDG